MSQTTLKVYGNRAPASDLISLQDAKDWLKVKVGVTEFDDAIQILISSASQEFENYIDNPIIIQRVIEIQDATGEDTLLASIRPVRDLKWVHMDESGQFAGLTTDLDKDNSILKVDSENYYLRDDNTIVFYGSDFNVFGRYTTGRSKGSIRLEYDAGYATDQNDLPADLRHACLMRVEQMFLARENRQLNVTSKRAADSQISYRVGELPPEITTILDRYLDHGFGETKSRFIRFVGMIS